MKYIDDETWKLERNVSDGSYISLGPWIEGSCWISASFVGSSWDWEVSLGSTGVVVDPVSVAAVLAFFFIFACLAQTASPSCMCSSNIAFLNVLPIFTNQAQTCKKHAVSSVMMYVAVNSHGL